MLLITEKRARPLSKESSPVRFEKKHLPMTLSGNYTAFFS